MGKEELEQKMRGVADMALRELEKRTGLQLQGLSPSDVKRRVKEWEKTQMVPKK